MSVSSWPAVVLAAGYGTRLRPLTERVAKPALAVGGVPLIVRLLRWLRRAGIRDVVINLHYRPETITGIVGDGTSLGVHVRYSWEREILGSAGGPARAMQLFDAPTWLIVNADTLTDVDLEAIGQAHRSSRRLATMALVPNPDPGKYGGVLVEGDRVTGFTPTKLKLRTTTAGDAQMPNQSWYEASASSYHFVGVQAVEREAFDGVPADRASSSVGDLYPRLMASHPGSVGAFVSNVSFFDIGTPEDYERTSAALAGRPEWP